jgi:hypothetical protein
MAIKKPQYLAKIASPESYYSKSKSINFSAELFLDAISKERLTSKHYKTYPKWLIPQEVIWKVTVMNLSGVVYFHGEPFTTSRDSGPLGT